MFKRWFEFSSNGDGSAGIGERRNGSTEHGLAVLEQHGSEGPARLPASRFESAPAAVSSDDLVAAEKKYTGPIPEMPQAVRGILKVVEMVNSEHLTALSTEAKRCAIMMALDAVGAGIEDLLQDAVSRQRALNDSDKEQQDALRRFEEKKAEEKRQLQEDLASLTSQYMARVEANAEEVAREQGKFRAWQRKKQKESQHIAEAASFCVPEGLGPHAGSLAEVLERAAGGRR